MSFWTLPSAVDRSRKLRSTLLNRETSPDTDMFFETTPTFSLGSGRSHFADRLGDVMSDARRGFRSFPSQMHHQHPSFESLHRQHSVPRRGHNWMEDCDDLQSTFGGHNLQRSDSIPIQVTHHPPRRHPSGSSRSSTPDTAKSYDSGSDGSSSCLASANSNQGTFEEHPGVTSRAAGSRPATFTAKRHPKVHHIPIRVEPRDNADGAPTSPQTGQQEPPEIVREVVVEESAKKEAVEKGSQKKSQDDVLEVVMKDLRMLRRQVEEFPGGCTRADKGYLYLDEMLTRNLIKLDDIVVEGDEEMRKKRRAAVREVNGCICALEEKLIRQDNGTQVMDHEEEKAEEMPADEVQDAKEIEEQLKQEVPNVQQEEGGNEESPQGANATE